MNLSHNHEPQSNTEDSKPNKQNKKTFKKPQNPPTLYNIFKYNTIEQQATNHRTVQN